MRAAAVVLAGVAIAATLGCRRREPAAAAAAATPTAGVTAPGAIDSHVHLAYWAVGAELAAAGLAAVVDLGAPLDAVGQRQPVATRWAGPLLTAPGATRSRRGIPAGSATAAATGRARERRSTPRWPAARARSRWWSGRTGSRPRC
jgi:hypothetical protein